MRDNGCQLSRDESLPRSGAPFGVRILRLDHMTYGRTILLELEKNTSSLLLKTSSVSSSELTPEYTQEAAAAERRAVETEILLSRPLTDFKKKLCIIERMAEQE